MGWWKSASGEVIGDGPLDETEAFLHAVAREYLDEWGRKPTLEELLACLATVLQTRTEEFTEDCDERSVTGVSATTTPRRKKQRVRPGDVFVIPLGDNAYAFGRVTPQDMFFEARALASARGVVSETGT